MKKLIGVLISLFILAGICPAQAEEEARGDMAYTTDLVRMKNDIANTKYRLTLLETANFVPKSVTDAISARVDVIDGKLVVVSDELEKCILATDATNLVLQLVPEWSRAATKPTYDYSEIENVPDLHDLVTTQEATNIVITIVPDWSRLPTKPSYTYAEILNAPDVSVFITESAANERFATWTAVNALAELLQDHTHNSITTADGTVGGPETKVVVGDGFAEIQYKGPWLPTDSGPVQEAWAKRVATVDQLDGFVDETITNGLASQAWVSGQGFVDETVTNGLASTSWVNAQEFVKENVTNGLASMGWVDSRNFVTESVTNGLASRDWVMERGFVDESVTNGLAAKIWVTEQGFVKEEVTNGLASVAWVNAQEYVKESITNGLAAKTDIPTKVSELTNDSNFVTQAITNGLASTNWILDTAIVGKMDKVASAYADDFAFFDANGNVVDLGIPLGAFSPAQHVHSFITTDSPGESGGSVSTLTLYDNGLAKVSWTPAPLPPMDDEPIPQPWTKVVAFTNDIPSTNGLASVDWVNSQEFVKESVTNGLASRDWVDSRSFVTETITNGLASREWVDLKQYVTESVTNGLASTNWVQEQDSAIWSQMQAHSHSNIVAEDTRIQVVNGGGAKIIQTKNALSRVTLPAGYTVKNTSDVVVYETQSGEVLLFNPKRIPSTQYNQDFWLPYGYEDVETWEDIESTYQGWVICSVGHGTDPSMMVKTDIRLMLQISNGTLTPMGNMTASGGSPVYENDIPYDEVEDIAKVSDIPNHYVEAVNGLEGRVQIGLLGEDPTFTVTPEYTNGLKLATFAFTNGWEQIQVWPEGVSGGDPEDKLGVQFDVYFPTSAIPDVSSFVTESVTNGLATEQWVYDNVNASGTNKLDSTTMAVCYDSSETYFAGDYVTHNGKLYKCLAETTGDFNTNKWMVQQLYKNKLYDAEVEWIEFRNGQYILSGIKANELLDFSITFKLLSDIAGEYGKHIFGVQWNAELMKEYGYGGGISVYRGTNGRTVLTQATAKGSFNTISLDGVNAYLNGQLIYTFGSTQFTASDFDFPIGAGKPLSDPLRTDVEMAISAVSIKKGGVLVRDYTAVRKGQVGYLYDRVTGQLFGNDGSGVLTPGPDKAPKVPEMDGIASAGTDEEYSRFDHVHPSDTTKADKVTNATTGDFAALDATGNLMDSGINESTLANIASAATNYTDTIAILKAPLDSPLFTGTPMAPTPQTGDNSTNIATTAFVQTEIDLAVTLSADAIAPLWQEGAYTNGDFVIYNKHLYECTNATSGVWTDGDWRQTSLSEMMGSLRSILHAINGD